MPIYSEENHALTNIARPLAKGDLYIKFDIIFPKNLNEEKK